MGSIIVSAAAAAAVVPGVAVEFVCLLLLLLPLVHARSAAVYTRVCERSPPFSRRPHYFC